MAEAVEEKIHARKGPSGADTWAVCYGAPAMQDGEENKSSIYARWGTCAHEVAGMILQDAVLPACESTETGGMQDEKWSPENAEGYVGRVFQIEGHDVEFDMEMADCVNDYVAQVESYWEPGDILIAEQAVPIDHITGEKGATGTSDCIILKPARREIIAIDLKGGKGVAVDAENNRQAAMYSDGAIVEHDLFYGPFDWVTSVIIQPRLFSVSEHRVSREEHDAFIAELKDAAAISAAADNAFLIGPNSEEFLQYLTPGAKQCRFCNAKAKCPALSGVVTENLKSTAPRADEFPDMSLPKQAANALDETRIGGLDEEALGKAMNATDLIELWLKAIRAEVERRLFDAKAVPGWYLGIGKKGNRAFTDKAQAEAVMKAAKVKADEMYSKTLITAPAAEKVFKDRPRIWAKLAPLIGQSDGKPSVCKVGDTNEPFKLGVEPEDFPDLDADETDPFS